MLSKRRTLIAIVATATLVGVLGAAGWWLWLPAIVGERVESAARSRALTATVGSVRLGLGSLVVRELQIRDDHGALQVAVGEVSTDSGLWDLAFAGTAGIRGLHVRDLAVKANLDSPGFRDLVETLRHPEGVDAGKGSRQGNSRQRKGRTIRVDGLEVDARDRTGPLFQIRNGRVAADAQGEVEIALGPIEVGRGATDGLKIERMTARVIRGAAGSRIEAVEVDRVELRYREQEAAEDDAEIWDRARRHLRTLSAELGSSSQESGGDDPSAPSEDGKIATLLGMGRGLLESRVAPGATFRLSGLSVISLTEGTSRHVLRRLDAEAVALEAGKIGLSGSGRPGRGGRVGWQLVVNPAELRAEGRLDLQRVPFVLITPFLPDLPWHQPEDTRLSGELSIEGRGATRVHMEGRLSVDNLALSSPRIAPLPVRRISLELEGQADWDPSVRRLELARATIGLGQARVAMSGSLEWPEEHYLIDVRATLPPTDCDSAIGAIPADLLAELGTFTFSGRLGGRVEARIDSRDLDSSSLTIRLANGCRFETAPALADVRRFGGPFRHRVVEPEGSPFEMETGPGTPNWVSIHDISPFFIHAVLGHEDAGFFRHQGFSTGSIEQALVRNLRAGRYVYGASTITMQLVKNVFLHREKTLARKVQEVLLTWWVESVMSKERILELYLNVIEYGPAVYGIRQAAEHYFGFTPADLGPAESAYLATILPNPKAYHSHWVSGAVPERFQRRVGRFLRTLGARDRYDADAVADGLERLQSLAFHRPGDPSPPIREHRGRAASLPFGPSLDLQWEEALGEESAAPDEHEEF